MLLPSFFPIEVWDDADVLAKKAKDNLNNLHVWDFTAL